jgi:flagellar hook assembly protein FlgD
VKITVYDLAGHKIIELINDVQEIGHHSILWDGKNDSGNHVGSGVYFYNLTFNNVYSNRQNVINKTGKMILLK